MLEKITEKDLDFIETLYNPISFSECMFSNMDDLTRIDDNFTTIRFGQQPLLSYEYLLGTDKKLSEKENFKLKEGAGNLWCLGGRRFGKTLIAEIIDLLVSMILLGAEHVGFSSLDALHIRGILEKVITVLENHPIYKTFKSKINRSPNFRLYLKTGYLLESINMNLTSPNPGAQFFQKHFTRIVIEEGSFETEEVYGKRLDAVSENGCVIRVAGMTNFTKYSPCGRIFYDLTKNPWVLNLPQYINPKWDDKEKQKAIKEHGGENSIGYRVFVKGEVVEEGISVFDMERVRRNYDNNKVIKHIELSKETFHNFKQLLIVERPKNVEVLHIDADIGETAPTEIIIIGRVNNKYKYLYNITLYNLTHTQQYDIFTYLIEQLNPNFIGLDTTEGTARAIYRLLEADIGKEHLVWCAFNEKIIVGFEKDDKDRIVFKDGSPINKEEYVSEWSIKRLKDLFYEEQMNCPIDYKLDIQLNSVIASQSGARTIYSCVSNEDHLFAAFRVFAIAEWYNCLNTLKPVMFKTFSKTGV